MSDPVDVLARDLCCLGPCDTPSDCSRKVWMRAARAHIRALERAGFKVIERPEIEGRTFWESAPTYGDEP